MPRAGNRRVRFRSSEKQQKSKQGSDMGAPISRVPVSNTSNNEQQVPYKSSFIANISPRLSPKSSPVAEHLELSEYSRVAAPRSTSSSAIAPPVLDPFTSVGSPGDLAHLPSLVEATDQIVYSNEPSTTALRNSTHGRIVELFGGKRMTSAVAHKKARSAEVLRRRGPTTKYAINVPKSNPRSPKAQNIPEASNIMKMGYEVAESVLESFNPPELSRNRQLVARHQHRSHGSDMYRKPAPATIESEELQDSQMSFQKRPVRQAAAKLAETVDPCIFLGMPTDLHAGMPAYYEWLKEHAYMDADYNFLPVQPSQQPKRSVRLVHSPASVEAVEVLSAPIHELTGFAAVTKDEFAPQKLIRGFETSYTTSHTVKPKPKAKVGTGRFFVVPLEYSREHDSEIQNRAARVLPPPRTTFGLLDGADDSDSDEGLFLAPVTRPSGTQSLTIGLDDTDDEEDQDKTPRASQYLTNSLRRTASVHSRRRRGESFAEVSQAFGGSFALDGSAFESRARSATTSGTFTPRRNRGGTTSSFGMLSKPPSLSAINEEDQINAFEQLNLDGISISASQSIASSSAQYVHAVILQDGRSAIIAPLDKKPQECKRSWGEFPNVMDKLHIDTALERANQNMEFSRQPQLIALTDAEPPSPESPVAIRRQASSIKLSQVSSLTNIQVDTRAIFLTPANEIPVYPQPGSTPFYNFLRQRPLFIFFSDGYIKRSKLTGKMVELFEDHHTAPQWASEIPDIKTQRATKEVARRNLFGSTKIKIKPSEIDLSTDRFVMYWETLIVKADIMRDCELAKEAARQLAREHS